jgi:hypothetical protein
VTDLSSIELPYPLAGRSPVANPAGREYGGGGGVVGKTNREKKGCCRWRRRNAPAYALQRGEKLQKKPLGDLKHTRKSSINSLLRRGYTLLRSSETKATDKTSRGTGSGGYTENVRGETSWLAFQVGSM